MSFERHNKVSARLADGHFKQFKDQCEQRGMKVSERLRDLVQSDINQATSQGTELSKVENQLHHLDTKVVKLDDIMIYASLGIQLLLDTLAPGEKHRVQEGFETIKRHGNRGQLP